MILVFACALALAQGPIEQPQRLRTVLPNGAVVLVERQPSAKSLSVQTFVSARAGGTYAQRHLLEHLTALGDGNLDTRLELEGGFLRAQTLREATVYQLDLPPGKLDLGLSALRELLKPRSWSQSQIEREMGILKLENRSRNSLARISDAAWSRAYGKAGASAFELDSPVAAAIASLSRSSLAPSNIAVVVAGDVELETATSRVVNELSRLTGGTSGTPDARPKAQPGGSIEADAVGEAVAVPVPSFRSPVTAAVLSAGLAIAADLPDGSVTYTPSSQRGLVILAARQGADLHAATRRGKAAELFAVAKMMGRQWVQKRLSGTSNAAFWRGLLLVQERDLRPETLRENIDAMTLDQFNEGLALFNSSSAIAVAGRASAVAPQTESVELAAESPPKGAPSVVELVDPSEELIAIEAIVALPMLSASERGHLGVIAQAIPRGTEQYPRREMRMVTSGAPVEVTVMPDHVRVSFTVAKGGLKNGLALMESLLRSASLRDEDLVPPPNPTDSWQIALQPVTFPVTRINPNKVRAVYARVFRPQQITLAVGGSFEKGSAQGDWQARMAQWQAPRSLAFRDDYSEARIFQRNVAGVETIDFASTVSPQDVYPRLLALFALGGGKGSTLFKTARLEQGLSYRQEAILTPTPSGIESRLLIETTPADAVPDRLKSALLKAVSSWQEVDRSRALAIAEAVVLRQNEFSPFYLSGPAPVVADLQGRTFLAGYWQMKIGQQWSPDLALANMRNVSLEVLKTSATEIVNGKQRVLKG